MQCEQMVDERPKKHKKTAVANENTLFILIPFRFDPFRARQRMNASSRTKTFSASC